MRIAEALQTTPNDLLGVGSNRKPSPRSLLVDRLNSAGQALSDHDLEVVIVQVEALVNRRPKKRRPSG